MLNSEKHIKGRIRVLILKVQSMSFGLTYWNANYLLQRKPNGANFLLFEIRIKEIESVADVS